MTFTLTLAWWYIPAALTAVSVLGVALWPDDQGGYAAGFDALFRMVIALFVSLLSWAVAGALK